MYFFIFIFIFIYLFFHFSFSSQYFVYIPTGLGLHCLSFYYYNCNYHKPLLVVIGFPQFNTIWSIFYSYLLVLNSYSTFDPTVGAADNTLIATCIIHFPCHSQDNIYQQLFYFIFIITLLEVSYQLNSINFTLKCLLVVLDMIHLALIASPGVLPQTKTSSWFLQSFTLLLLLQSIISHNRKTILLNRQRNRILEFLST